MKEKPENAGIAGITISRMRRMRIMA